MMAFVSIGRILQLATRVEVDYSSNIEANHPPPPKALREPNRDLALMGPSNITAAGSHLFSGWGACLRVTATCLSWNAPQRRVIRRLVPARVVLPLLNCSASRLRLGDS